MTDQCQFTFCFLHSHFILAGRGVCVSGTVSLVPASLSRFWFCFRFGSNFGETNLIIKADLIRLRPEPGLGLDLDLKGTWFWTEINRTRTRIWTKPHLNLPPIIAHNPPPVKPGPRDPAGTD